MQRIHDSAPNWRAWWHDFLHGRTHVAYALIASTAASAYGELVADPLDLRIAFLVSLIGALGGLVDTVAHLFYH